MNKTVERLKRLRDDLEAIERDHTEALGSEPLIARPLHQAAAEARRRYKHVTEGTVPGNSGPHAGYVP